MSGSFAQLGVAQREAEESVIFSHVILVIFVKHFSACFSALEVENQDPIPPNSSVLSLPER